MADTRSNILHGAKEAARLHFELGLQDKLQQIGGYVDVYKIAADFDIPVMFRKLDGLLGAYLPTPSPGILITTSRPPSVQRFTCAHELGHYRMKHEQSLDDETQIGFAYSGSPRGRDMELQADAFAFTFLMPRWLVNKQLRHFANVGMHLPNPQTVYQISLRLGCSFSATVYALTQYKLLDSKASVSLQRMERKQIKQSILEDSQLEDWHRDVWILTEADRDIALEANQGDVFVIRLVEPSTAGYVTDVGDLERLGFSVLSKRIELPEENKNGEDWRDATMPSIEPNEIGDFPHTTIVSQANTAGKGELNIKHARPWESSEEASTALAVQVAIRAPDLGLSPEERQLRLSFARGNH